MKFDFNLYSSLLLIGFVQGIVYAGLLIWRGIRKLSLADKMLGLLLLTCSFHIMHYMLGFAGWFDGQDGYTTFMFYFPLHNNLFIGPFIYLFFRALSNSSFRISGKVWWHLLPGLLNLGLYLFMFLYDLVWTSWISGETLECFNGTKGAARCGMEDSIGIPLQVLWVVSMAVYVVMTLRAYYQYRNYINDHFSDTEAIRFGWIRNLLWVVAVGLAVSWVSDLVNWLGRELSYQEYWFSYFSIASMVYIVGHVGYHRRERLPELHFEPRTIEEMAEEVGGEGEEENGEVLEEGLEPMRKLLVDLMEKELLYLQSGLTLQDLAARMETNSSVLSRLINVGFGQNFNDFINSHRVDAVCKRLDGAGAKQLTLVAIAEEAGFNSKSTFNRAFRKFTQMTPREYLNRS